MPAGRNAVGASATLPVFDPKPIRPSHRRYITTPFDLPPFHVAGFVSSLAYTTGYPVQQPLILSSATVTVRATGGTSITFTINVNGVPLDSHTIGVAGLWVFPQSITLAVGDIVTMEITDIGSGALQDFLVVLRVDPFFAAPDLTCIDGVMGSGDWLAPYDGPLTYDAGGDFYWTPVALGPQAMFWPTAFSGFQSIEVTVTNMGPLEDAGDVLMLWCRSTDISDESSGVSLFARKYEDPVEGPLWEWFVQADGAFVFSPSGDIGLPSGQLFWPYGATATFRLESDVDGSYRIFINEGLLYSDTFVGQPVGTTFIGFSGERAAAGDETTTMHMAAVCVIGG